MLPWKTIGKSVGAIALSIAATAITELLLENKELHVKIAEIVKSWKKKPPQDKQETS